MALVVAGGVCIAPLLTTTPKHEEAYLGLRRRVGLDPALLVGLLQIKLSHALSRCLALVTWLLNGLGHGLAFEDLVVARLTCCATLVVWCLCLVQEKLLLCQSSKIALQTTALTCEAKRTLSMVVALCGALPMPHDK
jgi:hypothetical protein